MLRLCGRLLTEQAKPLAAISLKQNANYLQIAPKPQQICLPRRYVSFDGPGSKSMGTEEKIQPMGWFLLTIPIVTFALGCWQTKRRTWKEQLLKDMDTLTKMPPADMPDDLATLNDMEYRAVNVKGKFLHEKEMLIGPRGFIRPDGAETGGGLISQRDTTNNGYLVVTPFKLSGRDEIVLVNRGWIPRKNMKPISRQGGQIPDEVEMTCVVRKGEQRPQFTPAHTGDLFLYRDLPRMCALTGALPVFLDASYQSTVAGGPVGGQTRITLRNDHLSYLLTWYSLSLATGFMWYRTIMKRKPF